MKTPMCLVTGFLGSGKTTLLKRWASQYRDRKYVYLVNEFSSYDIDGAMVAMDTPDVVTLAGGSIFCRCLVDEFAATLRRIADTHDDLDGVIVEASGMADPSVIETMLREHDLSQEYEVTRIITIVDPGSFVKLRFSLPNIRAQIEAADVLLLNKTDIHPEAMVRLTEEEVRAVRPDAKIIRCHHANARLEIPKRKRVKRELGGSYALCRDPNYSSCAVTFSQDMDLSVFTEHVSALESDLFRAKGFIPARGRYYHFDFSQGHMQVEEATPPKRKDATVVFVYRGNPSPATRMFLHALTG